MFGTKMPFEVVGLGKDIYFCNVRTECTRDYTYCIILSAFLYRLNIWKQVCLQV